MQGIRDEVFIVAASGIKFPTDSRQYLMDLTKDVAEQNKEVFIILAGHIIDGRFLETELKAQVKFEIERLRQVREQAKTTGGNPGFAFNREQFENDFALSVAHDLSDFLPKIKGANYHIVVAEKVFDRPIGVRILEHLQKMRTDVRLLGKRPDGRGYDTEVKVPVRMKGFEEIRVIVPRRQPWFYRIITSFMQRLINSFVTRTFSPKPALILVGCTGTSSYLPFFEGVPSISIPTLHKIDEQFSTENMVGCVSIKAVGINGKVRIIPRYYDWRTVVSREREFIFPEGISKLEKMILNSLKFCGASLSVLLFRLNSAQKKAKNGRRAITGEDEIREAIGKLMKRGIVVHRKTSNRFEIDEHHLTSVRVSLGDLLRDTRVIKHAAASCFHVGALKTLYYTAINYLPRQIRGSDVFIDNGDIIQGIHHGYEYNGELLPIVNGFDKQEILAAHLRAKNILDVFKMRLKEFDGRRLPKAEILKRCLITYIFNIGNHPAWKYRLKDALLLVLYEKELKGVLISGIIEICAKAGINIDYDLAKEVVDEKVRRISESKLVNLDGVVIGVKHPFKSRTISKSHRIQDVVEFFHRVFDSFTATVAKGSNGFAQAFVANFHEAAATFVVKFGKSVFGVMTGAQVKDSEFESNQDKVVDHGIALVEVCLDKNGLLIYGEVEFDNSIHPDDGRIVFADRVMTSDVNTLCADLTKIVDMPWR